MAVMKEFPVHVTADEQGPSFRLGNTVLRALPVIPAGLVVDLPDEGMNVSQVAAFVRSCLVDEDQTAYDDALRSRTHLVDKDELVAIYLWLVGEAYNAPFSLALPTPSFNGREPTGVMLTDASSVTGST